MLLKTSLLVRRTSRAHEADGSQGDADADAAADAGAGADADALPVSAARMADGRAESMAAVSACAAAALTHSCCAGVGCWTTAVVV